MKAAYRFAPDLVDRFLAEGEGEDSVAKTNSRTSHRKQAKHSKSGTSRMDGNRSGIGNANANAWQAQEQHGYGPVQPTYDQQENQNRYFDREHDFGNSQDLDEQEAEEEEV